MNYLAKVNTPSCLSEGLSVPEELELKVSQRLPSPTSDFVANNDDNKQKENEEGDQIPKHYNRCLIGDSQIGLQLKYLDTNGKQPDDFRQLEKRFIRCSSYLTIEHLKKYLRLKLNLPENSEVDILCNGEIMGKHHTLEFIYMTRWRFMDTLLSLDYRPKMDLNET